MAFAAVAAGLIILDSSEPIQMQNEHEQKMPSVGTRLFEKMFEVDLCQFEGQILGIFDFVSNHDSPSGNQSQLSFHPQPNIKHQIIAFQMPPTSAGIPLKRPKQRKIESIQNEMNDDDHRKKNAEVKPLSQRQPTNVE